MARTECSVAKLNPEKILLHVSVEIRAILKYGREKLCLNVTQGLIDGSIMNLARNIADAATREGA